MAVPDERADTTRSLVSMKHYLVMLRTRMVNRLHALYVRAGMTFAKKSDLLRAPRGSGWRLGYRSTLRGLQPPLSGN